MSKTDRARWSAPRLKRRPITPEILAACGIEDDGGEREMPKVASAR